MRCKHGFFRWYQEYGFLEKLEKNHNINGNLKILKNGDENTRCDAARALGRLKDHNAIEGLIESLEDESGDVRWNAASALGVIGDRRAVRPLINILKQIKLYVKFLCSRFTRYDR